MVKSLLNNIKRLMKTFYNSHLPEQWLMRLHLKHKRPGALDARDCFIIINVSGSSCTRRSRIAPSRAHWSLKIWHERDLAGYCNLTRSVILGWWIVPNFLTMLAARGCAHVRRCPNWQCWRDSASGIENHRGKEEKIREKIRQTHAERLASWGPKAGQGNWPLVGATSLF